MDYNPKIQKDLFQLLMGGKERGALRDKTLTEEDIEDISLNGENTGKIP